MDEQRPDLHEKKSALEVQKLEAEVVELRKPWYLRPAILQPIATIAVTVLAAIIGYGNGWFSTKLESLHNAQDKAEISLQKMNEKRSALNTEIAELTSERDDVALQLTQAYSVIDRLQREYQSASAKAAEDSQCQKEFGRISTQLKATANQLASAQSAKANIAWQLGDIVAIRVVQGNAGPPFELTVNFPIDDKQALKKVHNASEYWGSPPDSYDCSGEYGTCFYKVGRAAMALGYISVEAHATGLSTPEFETIPNGTKQWTVTMKGSYVGPHGP
jgi:hypothetical protein